MSPFQWCLPPGFQPIQYKHHHSWSAGKFLVFCEFQTFEKVKILFEKKQIIIFKKAQNIEISHSISTILTNDPKYSTVADVKIYAIIVAIWGCLLCIIIPFPSHKNPVSGYEPYFSGEESKFREVNWQS